MDINQEGCNTLLTVEMKFLWSIKKHTRKGGMWKQEDVKHDLKLEQGEA
jgi:hypothetical protein